MIVRSAAFSRGRLTCRRATRSWCRRRSSSASGSLTRSRKSTRSRSSRGQAYMRPKSIGGRNP